MRGDSGTEARLQRRRGRCFFVIAIAMIAVLGLVLAGTASADKSSPSPLAAKTMRFRVLNATMLNLTVRDRTLEKGHWRGNGPYDMRPLRVADFVMESESLKAKGDIRWRIGDTNYLLKVWGNVDGPSSNCAIQNLDRQDVSNSPYSCTQRLEGGADSDQYTVVQPKDGATRVEVAGQQRRLVYETLCGTAGVGATNYASCKVDAINIGTGDGLAQESGDILANCGVGKFELETTGSYTASQTNTVGGSIGVEYESPAKIFSLKVEFTSEWNQVKSSTIASGLKLEIPGRDDQGRYVFGWVESRPRVQTARANIVAKAGNQTFDLPNVNVIGPLAKPGGQSVKRAESSYLPTGYCDGTSRVALEKTVPPPTLNTDEVYAFGVRGYNQRVVNVPGNTKESGIRLNLGQFGDSAGQRWLLSAVGSAPGYYLIRSDNDLDLCLDEWVAQNTVIQYPCKPTTRGDVINQLWKLDYGTTNDSFQLQNKENGKVIAVEATAAGTGFTMVNPNAAGVYTRWELSPATPGSAPTVAAQPSSAPLLTPAGPNQDAIRAVQQRTIRFRVLNATPLALTVSADSTNGLGHWRERPAGAATLKVDDYTDTNNDSSLSAWVKYRIGTTSTYFRVSAGNPLAGYNSSSCQIENSAGTPISNSAYSCKNEHGSGVDMNAFYVVQPKDPATHTVDVRNSETRAAVLDAVCGLVGEAKYESCGIRTVDDISYGLAPAVPLGDIVINCGVPGTIASPSQSSTETTSSSISVGVSVEGKKSLVGTWKLVGKAYYKHTWTETNSQTTKYAISVPSGYFGWMERASPVANLRADYVVEAGNQTYIIPAVTVSAPAIGSRNVGVVIGRAYQIPSFDQVCKDRTKEVQLTIPLAPTIGGTYAIRLGDANQRVITSRGQQGQLELGAFSSGNAKQEWEFAELPGKEGSFQIRNVANPNLCLDQDVAVAQTIEYPCKTADVSDVANQLWTVALDPTTNSYRLVSTINGRGVEAASDAIGAKLGVSANPSTQFGRWEFKRAAA